MTHPSGTIPMENSRFHAAKGVFRSLQPLVLASASPRRKEMLLALGLEFEVVPSEIEETTDLDVSPDRLVEHWARRKADSVAQSRPGAWVLAADTIVVLDGEIFGKPGNSEEARSMLSRLSGRSHEVISAICLARRDRDFLLVKSVRTRVHFRILSREEIHAYVNTGEPMDKAGAYGIQGMGGFLVELISGSYTNVVGLPLSETLEWLLENELIAPVS